ncbi:MAG: lysophospholipid acyltransferase family protein, partial [Planctomycetota bacterium]
VVIECSDRAGAINSDTTHLTATVKPRKKKNKTFKPVRNLLEYVAFQCLRLVVACLPEPVITRFSRLLGDVVFFLDRRHRKIAKTNVSLVMNTPADSPETKALARASFRNLVRIAAEFVRMPTVVYDHGSQRQILTEIKGREKVDSALSEGKGIIFVTGHTGNWELMGAYVSSVIAPLTIVSIPFRNPLLNNYLSKRRHSYKQKLIPKKGALLHLARTLKKGEVVVLLVDQHAGRNEPKLDFLGFPAHTYITPGALAARFNVPVIAGFCYREGPGFHYKVYFEDPIYTDPAGDPQEEALRVARYANEKIGKFVRAHPEQWLWMHRRWR